MSFSILNNQLALETIDFQSRSFGDKIAILVSAMMTKLNNKETTSSLLAKEPEVKMLEDLIFKEKGMRIRTITDGTLAAILPFYPNKNLNLLHEFIRGNFTVKHQEEIISKAVGKKGTVDLKTGRVGGIFSEGYSVLYMNVYVLMKTFGMTAGEITAFILHELGHAYSACEYSDRFTRTNQVLANASREIFKKNGKKNLDYVFKELKSVNKNITIEEADAIVNGDRIIAGVKWHKFLVDTVISEMKNDKYNENSFEQLSDSYASRHGYGKELVTGLDRLTNTYGSVEKLGVLRTLNYIADAVTLIIMPFVIIAGISVAPFITGIVLVLYGMAFYSEGDAGRSGTYDELKQRYMRVRAEIISFLKDQNLSAKEIESSINTINAIDAAIETTKDYNPLSRIISNFLIPSNRNARNDIEYQKTLEALVNNDMFLMAAKFKTL